jgi:biotin operon repressor
MGARVWTPEMDQYVREHYGKRGGAITIGAALGVSKNAVITRARSLGLNRPKHRWTAEEDAMIFRDFGRRPVAEIASELGLSILTVRCRSATLNSPGRRRRPAWTKWTPEREALVMRLYGVVPYDQLAARLGVSKWALYRKAKELDHQSAVNRYATVARSMTEAHQLRILLAWSRGIVSGDAACKALGLSPEELLRRATIEAVAATKGLRPLPLEEAMASD